MHGVHNRWTCVRGRGGKELPIPTSLVAAGKHRCNENVGSVFATGHTEWTLRVTDFVIPLSAIWRCLHCNATQKTNLSDLVYRGHGSLSQIVLSTISLRLFLPLFLIPCRVTCFLHYEFIWINLIYIYLKCIVSNHQQFCSGKSICKKQSLWIFRRIFGRWDQSVKRIVEWRWAHTRQDDFETSS